MINTKLTPWIRKLVLALSQILLTFAAGCGPEPTAIVIRIPTATGSPTLTPEVTQTDVPTTTPEPSETPFVPAAVIKLFSQSPLSGGQAALGLDMLRGAELAVQQLSVPLSEFQFKVELVNYDDQSSAKKAVANAQQIVADPEILCGIGHYDSDVTIQASNVYHQAALAVVAPAATAPLLTDRNFREVNRVIGHRDGQGAAGAQFAKAQGFTSVYVVSQEGESSLRNAEYFRREADRLGIQVLGMVVTAVNAQSTGGIVSQIMHAEPELVYISSPAEQAIPFLNALRAARYTGALLGTEELNGPYMIDLADPSLVEGGMYYTVTTPPAQYFSDASIFIEDFQTQYGTAPLSLAARAYDATGVCLRAIYRATKAKNGVLPTREEVARAIRRLKGYKGITGTIEFNDRGDPAISQYYVVQITSVDDPNLDENSIVASYEVAPP
jgi:branched-chain amino acid transport system substrate-binding protein